MEEPPTFFMGQSLESTYGVALEMKQDGVNRSWSRDNLRMGTLDVGLLGM